MEYNNQKIITSINPYIKYWHEEIITKSPANTSFKYFIEPHKQLIEILSFRLYHRREDKIKPEIVSGNSNE